MSERQKGVHLSDDEMQRVAGAENAAKDAYQREGIGRNNAYYGYVPKLEFAAVHPSDATPTV